MDQIHITIEWPRESERDHQFKQACCDGINFMALWLQFVRVLSSCVPFYLLLLPLAELHVGIGFYRLGVKYGFITRSTRSRWQRGEYMMMGGFVAIGLMTLLRLWLLAG